MTDEILQNKSDEWEARLLSNQRKEMKRAVEIAKRTDRSQFKKTNQRKQTAEVIEEGVEGRVVLVTGSHVRVQVDNQILAATFKGRFRQGRALLKNDFALGDRVLLNAEQQIVQILPRRTLLARQVEGHVRQGQLLAANIDQVALILSLHLPSLTPHLIDRVLLACEQGTLPCLVIINKCDLSASPREEAQKEAILQTYPQLGIPVFCTQAENSDSLCDLKNALQGKSTLFVGHSGTGKSSLINALTGSTQVTRPVVQKTKQGAHTTSTAQIIALSGGGECIDTPGIRSLGLWQQEAQTILHHYKEFFSFSGHCRYANCTHRHEPGCAVKAAVEEGKISSLRYTSYVGIY